MKEEKRVLDFDEAREIVVATVRALNFPRRTENVSLMEAHGRVLSLKAQRSAGVNSPPSLQSSTTLDKDLCTDMANFPPALSLRTHQPSP